MDENYFALAQDMLHAKLAGTCPRAAFGTHDVALIRRIAGFAAGQGIGKNDFEVQMLYGIQRAEQERLAQDGCRSVVLVAYGTYWYPWFVRRLAERPPTCGSCSEMFSLLKLHEEVQGVEECASGVRYSWFSSPDCSCRAGSRRTVEAAVRRQGPYRLETRRPR